MRICLAFFFGANVTAAFGIAGMENVGHLNKFDVKQAKIMFEMLIFFLYKQKRSPSSTVVVDMQ